MANGARVENRMSRRYLCSSSVSLRLGKRPHALNGRLQDVSEGGFAVEVPGGSYEDVIEIVGQGASASSIRAVIKAVSKTATNSRVLHCAYLSQGLDSYGLGSLRQTSKIVSWPRHGVDELLKELRDRGGKTGAIRSARFGGVKVHNAIARNPTYVLAIQHRKSRGGNGRAHTILRRQLALGRVGRAILVPRILTPQIEAMIEVRHYLTCYPLSTIVPGKRVDPRPPSKGQRTVASRPKDVLLSSNLEVNMGGLWPTPRQGTIDELLREADRVLDPNTTDDQLDVKVNHMKEVIRSSGSLSGGQRLRLLKKLNRSLASKKANPKK
jgi:hypothetical protein